MHLTLASETETLAFGARLYKAMEEGGLVYLHGPLGAGKTTLARGCLRAAGYSGVVKSPTYTLVEEYALDGRKLYHFDLYRLSDPEELEFLGMRDYLTEGALCLIEWPEKGSGYLPAADLDIVMEVRAKDRLLKISPLSPLGKRSVDRIFH